MKEESKENSLKLTSEETLKSYGLDANSINTYFNLTGRGPVAIGEINILTGLSTEEVQKIIDVLLEKGLVRSIPSIVPRYEALPPYMVLLQQLNDFQDFVRNLQSGSSSSLGIQLKKVQDSIDKIKQLKDFQNSLNEVRDSVPKSINDQLKKFEDQISEFTHLEKIRSFIHQTESDMTKSLEEQFGDFEEKSDTQILKQFTEFENFMNEIKMKFMQDLQIQFGNFMGQFGRLMDSFMSFSQFIVNTSEMTPDLLRKEFKKFEDQVQGLKSKISQEFETRFKMKAFKQFIENFVQDIVIKEFNSIRESFQDDVIKVTASTFSRIEEQTENISGNMLTEIDNLKSLFSEKIVQGVENNVNNIDSQMKSISNAVKTQLITLEELFRKGIINKLQENMQEAEKKIDGSTQSITDDLKVWLTESLGKNIRENLIHTLNNLDKQLSTSSSDILDIFTNLENIFRENIINSLQEVLKSIEQRIELSEKTMKDFWQIAKEKAVFKFEDIWFVRGREGMIAQINELINHTKARILIVAPNLEDIDVTSLKNLSSHINVRIAAKINLDKPTCKDILNQLQKFSNIELRNYIKKDLWGAVKDGEEIVIGVASEKEVAGMASILIDHVRMFLNPLENAWLIGKKQWQ